VLTFKRDIENKIKELSQFYSCLLLTGARQVGKTTLLRNLSEKGRGYVTLDDLDERRMAQKDPAFFLTLHPAPVLIDEVQYAPQLFSYIKIAIDNGAVPGAYWLTGSQIFKMMDLAQESLAGRAAILHMLPLSQHEIYGSEELQPFEIDIAKLQNRKIAGKKAGLSEIYERIFQGSMPGYRSGKYPDRNTFYSSFLETYISRDVSDILPKADKLQFQDFIRACACRTGQMLNMHDVAVDSGISEAVAKHWLGVLEKSDIIYFLRPYKNNLLQRVVKTPKLYFYDTGLVCYLTKYSAAEILQNGALNGAILETYVVGEILKSYANCGLDSTMWYFRDNKAQEIDLVMEQDGILKAVEIKRSISPDRKVLKNFALLNKGSVPLKESAVICLREELSAFDRDRFIVPVWMI